MANALRHRGPDGEGFWHNEEQTVQFAHRRLSIVDLSAAADQPFHYKQYTLVFNGEIYNYIELKQELQSKGYHFNTTGDTEIVPAAYDYWGKDCLHHFDGMFVFALYDANTQQVFIARDRFGEKPLYYHAVYEQRRFQQFYFASEMKALWAAGAPKHLNGTMMLNYLSLGYTQNPIQKTATFYNDILSLPPGHLLTVNPQEGRVQMQRWYKPESIQPTTITDTSEAVERFRQLFFTSVNRRLRSDVHVGTSLSGGIDSSSVMAAIHYTKSDAANWTNMGFTAVFPGFAKDESVNSKAVADHFNVQQFTVQPTVNDWIDHWQQFMYHQEEPVQSSSVFVQYMVYQLAKQHDVTVLLDGQGADEMLAGYKKYTHWHLQQLSRNDFTAFRKEKALLEQNEFISEWSWKNYMAAFFPAKAAATLQDKAMQSQAALVKHNFINADFLHKYQNEHSLEKPVVKKVEDLLYYNTFHVGLQELLRYADRNSMAHSREVRLPFLYHELVEFIFSLPANYKIHEGFTKWILRTAMQDYLPQNIVWQKGKIGYEPPQKQWLANDTAKDLIISSREKLADAGVLHKKAITSAVTPQDAHEAGNLDWRTISAAAIL